MLGPSHGLECSISTGGVSLAVIPTPLSPQGGGHKGLHQMGVGAAQIIKYLLNEKCMRLIQWNLS